MISSYNEFKNKWMGKAVDKDGYYGAQCWDGEMEYHEECNIPMYHCNITGYVQDIYNQRKTSGILNYTHEHTLMNPGDIAFFKPTPNWTPYSHVCIFDSDIDGKFGWFFGQNQGGKDGAFNLCKLPYFATFDTALRPLIFDNCSKTNSKADTTQTEVIDQILHVGSYVVSCAMQIGIKDGVAIKKIDGDECCYLKELGGWFPTRLVSKTPGSDGYYDQVLHNTKAKVVLDRIQVTGVNKKTNTVCIDGIWVSATPLIEVK